MNSSCSDACACMLHVSDTFLLHLAYVNHITTYQPFSIKMQIALVKDGIIAQAKVGEDSYKWIQLHSTAL